MESEVRIRRDDMEQVAISVFATMLGLELREDSGSTVSDGAETLTATVCLTGGWQGAVVVQCNPEDARRFAGCFLGEPPPAGETSVVRDVLGEIANMIAGNFKCTLYPGIRVSVPSVVSGTAYSVRLCGARLAEQITFTADGCRLRLSIFDVPLAD